MKYNVLETGKSKGVGPFFLIPHRGGEKLVAVVMSVQVYDALEALKLSLSRLGTVYQLKNNDF
ncbi:hypothetical protein [Ostreibacterium oceani]|uniref:Uncharacterized protein n=1 Tax=Ostreibacterium oceani TaxID=2654998 RepID=A0A6N7EW41_9GAMM|nr:hypothetical protein [Ostreibacterium oceani]MPV85805.1 hypothetical protein [Ostreibacterium oceani]